MISALIKLFDWFNGVVVNKDTIRVRQKGGWVAIRRDEIHAVKYPKHGPMIVRLRHGPRMVLDARSIGWKTFERLHKALTRGLVTIKRGQTWEQPPREKTGGQ
ncbi:MAG: hypothetical protein ABFD69_10655 [Candidatus Sumerlaeia bacterium]